MEQGKIPISGLLQLIIGINDSHFWGEILVTLPLYLLSFSPCVSVEFRGELGG